MIARNDSPPRAQRGRPRRLTLKALVERFGPVSDVGAGERWPRSDGHGGPAFTPARIAAWLREHARAELDEVAFVRLARQGVVDVAVGVIRGDGSGCWTPAGHGWARLGLTRELLRRGGSHWRVAKALAVVEPLHVVRR